MHCVLNLIPSFKVLHLNHWFYFSESDRVPGFGSSGSSHSLGSTLGLQSMLSHHHFMGQHRSADASSLTAAAAAAAAASINPETAKSFLMHTSHALSQPSSVELRPSKANPKSSLGVYALETLSTATRFGPFLGKWAFEPGNPNQAWEVRNHVFIKTELAQKYHFIGPISIVLFCDQRTFVHTRCTRNASGLLASSQDNL